jgi:hypothetical protein
MRTNLLNFTRWFRTKDKWWRSRFSNRLGEYMGLFSVASSLHRVIHFWFCIEKQVKSVSYCIREQETL